MRRILLRILLLLVVLFFSVFLVYTLLYLAPGDPIGALLGPQSATPGQVQLLREQYGLDDPFFERFSGWLWGVLQGDLGRSMVYQQSVFNMILARVPTTLLLVGLSTLFIVIIGFTWGTRAGISRGAWSNVHLAISTVLLSTPVFITSVGLIYLFAVVLGWFPAFGSGSDLITGIWHMVLPVIALSLPAAAYLSRITYSSVRGELNREHVETAESRGFSRGYIIRTHVVRNALIPMVTVAGNSAVTLVAGSAIIETIFALDGVGSLLVRAILQSDFALAQGILLFIAVFIVLVNAFVDTLYFVLDPRIRRAR
ncbi:ABC transporter permease [Nesterenkonia muleiensis]|uniref:ABC transporter permease n=1 Tax=Nesterenkonia muleiensis TaxID=2282648 RepID=UPI000E7345A0|nr:ABC transporter permease [Nesterenkonia muleiensis]